MIRTRYTRRGVTLVEMLVATAMCIAGMWMLTWMFKQATDSFTLANQQVALTSQERLVTTVMTRDLEADKFLEDDRQQNRGRKLADMRTDRVHVGGYVPPRGGYFWAKSGPVDGNFNIAEPNGDYNFGSARTADHFLQFTVILPDTPGNRFFSELRVNPGPTSRVFAGVAAEVGYYLVRAGQAPEPYNTPLYDLIRVQRLTAQSDYEAADYDKIAVGPGAADAPDEVMTVTNNRMRTLGDLTVPIGFGATPRFAAGGIVPLGTRTARPTSSRRYGEDRLMSNILSFEVKFTGELGAQSGLTTPWPTPFANGNTDFPYDTLPFNNEFDTFSTRVANWNTNATWANAANPGRPIKPIRITGAQIRIRALSGTTARQTTIVVTL